MNLESQRDIYKIDLEMFEGPLDLLLHLIKKNDLDILDIPIAFILEQYMAHLELMDELNIDLAGDFLLMASELAHIKSRLLLPDQGEGEDEEELGDPRADLIRRLLEYQRYKEAAQELIQRPMLGRDVFTRLGDQGEVEEEEGPVEADLFHLLSSFHELLKKAPKTTVHEVQIERVSVTERIYELMDLLREKTMVEFTELFEKEATRDRLIVTFLAILEMARLKMIQVTQAESYGQIYLVPTFESVDVQSLSDQVTLQ